MTPSDLSHNSLTSLPDSFSTLPQLTNFNAGNNSLTGSIPHSLTSHNTLVTLNLAQNHLSGAVLLDGANLTSLNLEHNALNTIAVAKSITALTKVYLANNTFEGALPDLSGNDKLEVFDGSFNS